MSDNTVRLQAYLARAGVASRRASEDLIRAGKVRVNGVVAEVGMSVDGSADVVEVEGRVITPQRVQWIAVHKPKGYVTTRDDPEGRKTVYDVLPDSLRHLFHVGRLDRDSSGLLLLTNDGEAANRLLHPRYGTTKEYYADVEGEPEQKDLRLLMRGIQLEDGIAKAESIRLRDEVKPGIFRLAVVMKEGKRREVRRMLESIGHPVRRLFRRRFGPIEIGRLAPGEWRYLTAGELELLDARPASPTGAPLGKRSTSPKGTTPGKRSAPGGRASKPGGTAGSRAPRKDDSRSGPGDRGKPRGRGDGEQTQRQGRKDR